MKRQSQPNYQDNSGNSQEQENALNFWLQMVQDLKGQQLTDEAVQAELAARNCPDPVAVLNVFYKQQQHPPQDDQQAQPAPEPQQDEEMAQDSRVQATAAILAAMPKGSPYPENSAENAPDHSAPGHNLPDKVNEIYNACMREHSDYGKEKCMKIAWAASGKKHETKNRTSTRKIADDNSYNPQHVDMAYQHADNSSYSDKGMASLVQKLVEQGVDPTAARAAVEHWTLDMANDYGHQEENFPEGTFQQVKPPWAMDEQQQAPVQSHYLAGVKGEIVDRYHDVYGVERVRFATEYGVQDIEADKIQTEEGIEHERGPVDLIEEFVNAIPGDPTTRYEAEQRTEHLLQAHTVIANVLRRGGLGLADQMKLDEISLKCRIEAANLKEASVWMEHVAEDVTYAPYEQQSAEHVREFTPGVNDYGDWLSDTADTMEAEPTTDYEQYVESEPLRIVDDLDEDQANDVGYVRELANEYASEIPDQNDLRERFVQNVESARRDKVSTFKRTAKVTFNQIDLDSVADEGLFL